MQNIKITKTTKRSQKPKQQDDKLRAVLYTRVSTDHIEQESSLETQKQLTEKLELLFNAKVIHVYTDKGVSGTNTKNRSEFNKLIKDAENGEFDYVFVKNISRFARNLGDMVTYTRRLEEMGVYVYFDEEKMDTKNENAKFTLNVLASVAEQESRNTSAHIKASIQLKHSQGLIATKSRPPLGYDFVKVWDEEYGMKKWSYKKNKDAPIVRTIFQDCIDGFSLNYISKHVFELYDRKLPARSIEYILKNVAYKGDLALGKTYKDPKTGKRVFNVVDEDGYTQEDLTIVENHHLQEAIVTKEEFELATEADKLRRERNQRFTPANDSGGWQSKIVCGKCGAYYWIRHPKYLACSKSDKRNEWDQTCENTRNLRKDGLENALIQASQFLVLDAKRYGLKHYTQEQLDFIKKLNGEPITSEYVENGLFDYDEDKQFLKLKLYCGIEFTFTTPSKDALLKNFSLAIKSKGIEE